MKVLGVELGGGVDTSAYEFREDLVLELEKCIKVPFAMNSFSESQQFGEQEALKQIIEYIRQII